MGKFNIRSTPLKDAVVVESKPFHDHRGAFSRLFCRNELSSFIGNRQIVNINLSTTLKIGVVRGLHYQKVPSQEMKLVRCLRGAVFDVIVDLREDSATFLQWYGLELSENDEQMIVVPEGFAHGFQVLKENSEVLYFSTEFYSPGCESGLRYNDPALDIQWPLPVSEISEKDMSYSLVDHSFSGM